MDEEALSEKMETPKRIRTEEGTVEERPLKDIIEADAYQKTGQQSAVPYGMRIARCRPPGTI